MKSLLCVIKYNNYRLIILIITITVFFACEKEIEVAGFDILQTEKLLSGDSTKTWVRISRSEAGKPIVLKGCELENTLIFSISKVDTILNPLLFQTSCGDTLLSAGWLAKNDFGGSRTDSLLYLINPDTIKTPDTVYVNYDTLYNSIENITSQFLVISSIDIISGAEVLVKEEFLMR